MSRQRKKKPGRIGQAWERIGHSGRMAVTLIALAVLWELFVIVTDQPQYLLPKPTIVLATMIERWPLWLQHGWVTFAEIGLGFLLAAAVGIPLAIAIVYSRVLESILYPLLIALQAVPKIAVAPLFIVWFGFGFTPKPLIAFLIAFFPVVVDTVVGLRSINPEMLHLARVMGASDLKTFFWVRIPNALPNIFGGLKVGIILAVVGAVVGEFVGGDSGLGYVIVVSAGRLQTDLLFASLIVLSLMAIVLFMILEMIERAVLPWHSSERTRELGL